MTDKHDAQDQPTELNADDFIDRPPNREECRRLLDAANDNDQKIEAWNRLRVRFNTTNWRPDISDRNDPWNTSNYNYNPRADLAIDLHDADLIGARLCDMSLIRANLNDANLQKSLLGEAKLQEAQLKNANLYECDLRWTIFSNAKLMYATFGTPYGTDKKSESILQIMQNGPFFNGANLHGATFGPAILGDTTFQNANLSHTNFEGACIESTKFNGSNMTGANFRHSTIRDSQLDNANLESADFENTKLERVSLGVLPTLKTLRTHCRQLEKQINFRAKLYEKCKNFINLYINGSTIAREYGTAARTTNLRNTDLRFTSGLIPNGQSARTARFAARAKDPYSIVRQKYTGPMLFFHLLFLVAFFTPYIIRAGAWTAFERIQTSELVTQVELSGTIPVAPEMVEQNVFLSVLGFNSPSWGWAKGILASLFVLYNIGRAAMTWWLSQVRDAEERSGHLPEIREYWWCYTLHRLFMWWAFGVSVSWFVFRFTLWLFSTVSVPAAFA